MQQRKWAFHIIFWFVAANFMALTAFIIFLWGSGIRVLAYVPGPQRLFGLAGVAGFSLCLLWFHHTRRHRAAPGGYRGGENRLSRRTTVS